MTTKHNILTAALACFTKRGVSGTTIDDIRRESGASTGSIYHHFSGKEGLAGALYIDGLQNYQLGALSQIGPSVGARVGVVSIVAHHLSWTMSQPELARYLLQNRQAEFIRGREAEIREQNRSFVGRFITWLEGCLERNALRRLPRDLYLPLLLGPSHEFARHWLAGRMHTPVEEAATVLAEAAWRSVAPTQSG